MKLEHFNIYLATFVVLYSIFLFWPETKLRIQQLRKMRFLSKKVKPQQKPKGYPIPDIYTQIRMLERTCQVTRSQMVLLLHDNERISDVTMIVGNDLDLVRLISKASDKDEKVEEVLHIISKHYNAKYQS